MLDHTSDRLTRLIIKYIFMLVFVFMVSYTVQNKCYNVIESCIIISGSTMFMFVVLDRLFPEVIFIENNDNKNSFKQ